MLLRKWKKKRLKKKKENDGNVDVVERIFIVDE